MDGGISSIETYGLGWDQWPTSVRTLAAKCEQVGWDVRVGFSRGSVPGSGETRDIIGVWLDGYGRRAGAFWERNPDAEFSAKKLDAGVQPGEIPSGMAWKVSGTSVWPVRSSAGPCFPYLNLTEFTRYVQVRGAVTPLFWCTARTRVVDARLAAQGRAGVRPTKGHA